MHRGGDLAAVMQQAGDFQLIPVAVVHAEIGQRPFGGGVDSFGQHHREGGHALAVAAGVGRFFVNRQIDQADEGLEQLFELRHQEPIGQCNGGLRGH